jgi:hypothetical protein
MRLGFLFNHDQVHQVAHSLSIALALARGGRVLASGSKIRDRLLQETGLAPSRITVVGYPKFDLARNSRSLFYANGRPTILYNPHVLQSFGGDQFTRAAGAIFQKLRDSGVGCATSASVAGGD